MTSWLSDLARFSTNRGAWVQFATKDGGVGAYNPMTRQKLYGERALAALQPDKRHAEPEEHGLQHGAHEDHVDQHAQSVKTASAEGAYKKEWGSPDDWTEGEDAWGNTVVKHKDGKQVLKRGAAEAIIAEKKRRAALAKGEKKPGEPADGEERWEEGKDQWGNLIAKSTKGRIVKWRLAEQILADQKKRDEARAKGDGVKPPNDDHGKPRGGRFKEVFPKEKPDEPAKPGDLDAEVKKYIDSIEDPAERAACRGRRWAA